MSKPLPIPPPGFDDLSAEEKINYLQALWDRVAAHRHQVPVPDWHRQVLRERGEEVRESPTEGRPWEEVKDRLTKKLRDPGP